MTTSRRIADQIEATLETAGRSVAWLSRETGIAEKTLRRRFVAPDAFTIGELAGIARALDEQLEHLMAAEVNA